MKIIENIILALAVVALYSCSRGLSEPEIFPSEETRGLMEVTVTGENGLAEDKMETVRFIIFKDALGLPTLELNERFDIPTPTGGEVSKFKILLEVSRKANGGNDKMVVAIINEPSSMNNLLDAVATYDQLENLELKFADFLNADHNALQDGKLMPMTGVIITDKVYATEAEAENDLISLPVQRAVARVEVYLNQEAGQGLKLAAGTNIELANTYDKEYFVRNENGFVSFGKIQTVTSGLITKSWIWDTSDGEQLPEKSSSRLACSFYTPERTCIAANDADKLVLTINVVSTDGVTRNGKVTIDKFRLNGTGTDVDVDVILRNNIYKVTATVGSTSITSTVSNWNIQDIETEF